MNLHELAIKHGANKIWPLTQDYLPAYELYLSKFADKDMDLLEIGIEGGGSLKMWEEYLPKARITGIDINPDCAKLASGRIRVVIGDQGDKTFLREFAKDRLFDTIIDDGSHKVNDQVRSFNELWRKVKSGGLYVIEDLHTSYWPKWGGRILDKNSTIEYLKTMIDWVNWKARAHDKAEQYKVAEKNNGIRSLHIYSGICFIEKE